MSETTVPMDDTALFSSAMSDTPAEVTAPVETPVNDGPARDEHGRFAPKEAEKAEPVKTEAAVAPPATQPEAQVPSWRLREVNEAREAAERRFNEAEANRIALERRLAELERASQPKPEPIDPYSDFEGALKQRLSPFENNLQTLEQKLMLRASRAEAKSDYGKEAVEEMEQAIQKAFQENHPGLAALSAQMRNSDHPVDVAMQWHRREKLLKDTGGDLNSYRTKLQDELLKDPTFLAKAIEAVKGQSSTQTQSNLVQLPPSLSRATSAASPHEDPGDMSDGSLYRQAIR